MKANISIILCLLISILGSSCKKYLEAKPNKSLAIPTTIADFQAMLDHADLMNDRNPTYDEASADDYFLITSKYNNKSQNVRNAYNWSNYEYSDFPNDWSFLYDKVNISNIVLEGINKVENNNTIEWNNVKGSALFFRAQAFLRAAWMFGKSYDSNSSNEDLGIPLRLTSDFNVPSVRSNIEEAYNQIINDFKGAIELLPTNPSHVMRPSKASGYGFLARTYLSMRKYDSCFKYSNLCLQLKSDLIDYNKYSVSGNTPFSPFNPEVLFSQNISQFNYNSIFPQQAYVDTLLYSSYSANDLRKTAFFKSISGGFWIKGYYSGFLSQLFVGLATDEVYLMRAECSARLGDKGAALKDLNTLMIKRWSNNGSWVPFNASTPEEALKIILTERRKELIFRDIRWMDLKRLNKEGANIIIKRVINGQIYQLQPNDNKYALPIPSDIIKLTGMQQNPI